MVSKVAETPPQPAAPDAADESVEAEFVLHEELALPEGKALDIGNLVPATKEAVAAHAKELHDVEQAKAQIDDRFSGFHEIGRFEVANVPATYVTFFRHGSEPVGPKSEQEVPDEWALLEVEGTSPSTKYSTDDFRYQCERWAPLNTPRGSFLNLGDGRFTYVLRCEQAPYASPEHKCLGKSWSPEDGSVKDVSIPDYPTRGKDLDGDLVPEFPAPAFSYEVTGFRHATPAKSDAICNSVRDDRLLIDVLGVVGSAPRTFYEHRLEDARARAQRIEKHRGRVRKAGALRFDDGCALDAAQTAAELYAYSIILGVPTKTALEEADAVMKERALKPSECKGLVERGGKGAVDQWPAMRAALLAWKPKQAFPAADAGDQ